MGSGIPYTHGYVGDFLKSGILVEDSALGEEIKSGGIGEDELGWVQGG